LGDSAHFWTLVTGGKDVEEAETQVERTSKDEKGQLKQGLPIRGQRGLLKKDAKEAIFTRFRTRLWPTKAFGKMGGSALGYPNEKAMQREARTLLGPRAEKGEREELVLKKTRSG